MNNNLCNVVTNIRQAAIPLDTTFYDSLLDYIGDASIVLLGEATHGTSEFYTIRAEICQHLITKKGFNAIAIEGDWPDAYQINRYINNIEFASARQALQTFNRFPTWMWANVSFAQFMDWLKHYNHTNAPVNIYGLDLYSLYRSIDTIILYLDRIDPTLAAQARKYYACFEQFRHDPQHYGYAIFAGLSKSCQDEAIAALNHLEHLNWQQLNKAVSVDQAFYITQNALVVKNAEQYYRSLFINQVSNWNLRDSHMMETLEQLMQHYQDKGIANPKIVIWAHNSHIGNAAATQMGQKGEFNIGQLAKEKFGSTVFALGFTTYNGTVSAASDWQGPVERKIVRNALPESYEALFHAVKIPQFFLPLHDKNIVPSRMLERAIGVVYLPHTERLSHYFHANLTEQFDAIIHCDTTKAVEPLEKTSMWITEVPETYPSGL